MNLKTIIGRMYREIRQRGYYILGSIYAELNGTGRKSRKYLRECKDIHKGKRAFIIGNGPSLTKEDLEMLTNEITFASNRIYKMFDDTEWRPKYFTISDDGVARSGSCGSWIMTGSFVWQSTRNWLCPGRQRPRRQTLNSPDIFSIKTTLTVGVKEVHFLLIWGIMQATGR